MVGKFLVGAAAGLGVALLSSAAFAAIHPLGNLDPPSSSAFDEPLDIGPILSVGTFTLTKTGVTDASSTTIAVTHASDYTPGMLTLFKGAPFSGTQIDSQALVFLGAEYTASFTDILGPGSYYLQITGTANVDLGVAGTVATSSVPEPSTWAMLALGLGALGYAGFRRASKTSVAIV
jgi:hypothetical protein